MKNKFDINEAINYLNDNAIITTNSNDNFSIVDGLVIYRFNGSSVSLSIDTFKILFKDCTFSLIEDNSILIDELKDKEYYEKYKK